MLNNIKAFQRTRKFQDIFQKNKMKHSKIIEMLVYKIHGKKNYSRVRKRLHEEFECISARGKGKKENYLSIW